MGDLVDIGTNWKLALKSNAKGVVTSEVGNAYLMLTNGAWRDCIAYDEFTDRIFWAKQPPALAEFSRPVQGRDLTDQDTVYVQHYFSRVGNPMQVSFRPSTINEAISAAARKLTVHPLRDYLRSVEWDQVQRLPHWCHEYLGCEDTPYASAVGTWWLISAVARALEPGCQVDHMLLLEGPQGIRKSTALRVLAGDWYLPELPDVHTKDAAHSLHGRWICECGELEALRRSEVTAVKDFITRTIDIYRPAYGRNIVRRPRSVVFAGTTNNYQALSDPTGARRFWPIRCGQIDIKLLRSARDQLWAEARERFEAGEQYHPTEAMVAAITDEQEARYQDDSWEGTVLTWADQRLLTFTVADILGGPLEIPKERWSKSSEVRVGGILNRAGFQSRRSVVSGRKVRVYEPKSSA